MNVLSVELRSGAGSGQGPAALRIDGQPAQDVTFIDGVDRSLWQLMLGLDGIDRRVNQMNKLSQTYLKATLRRTKFRPRRRLWGHGLPRKRS